MPVVNNWQISDDDGEESSGNETSGLRPRRRMNQPQQLHSQVGFYLLPTANSKEQPIKRKSKRSRHSRNRGGGRWGSTNHLDAILEASDESANSTPGPSGSSPGLGARSSSYDDLKRYSSPGRLVRDNTAQPGLMMHQQDRRGGGGLRNAPGGGGGNAGGDRDYFETCFHPQARICTNIKYNLHQMRVRSQKDAYMAVVDAVAVGPETVKTSEAERILGINQDVFLKSKSRRKVTTLFTPSFRNFYLGPSLFLLKRAY